MSLPQARVAAILATIFTTRHRTGYICGCLTSSPLRAPHLSGPGTPGGGAAGRGAAVARTPVTARGGYRAADFPSTPSSVPAARHLVQHDLAARQLPRRVIDDSLLVVSELMTNAVRHARPLRAQGRPDAIRLRWTAAPDRVLIDVTDGGGPGRPHVATADIGDVGGRGLAIVQALAIDWGVTRAGPSVTVYAVVAA
jgi:anti-sigma regulatory factor (Ser/Thr protein kinase)